MNPQEKTNVPQFIWIAGAVLICLFLLLLGVVIGVAIGLPFGAQQEASRRDKIADAKKANGQDEAAKPAAKEPAQKPEAAPEVKPIVPKAKPLAVERKKFFGKWEMATSASDSQIGSVWEFRADNKVVIHGGRASEIEWSLADGVLRIDSQQSRFRFRFEFENDDKKLAMYRLKEDDGIVLGYGSPIEMLISPRVMKRFTPEREKLWTHQKEARAKKTADDKKALDAEIEKLKATINAGK